MRTLKQIKQQDGVNSLKAIHIQAEEAKSELAASTCSTARFKIEGTWIGGCDWESQQVFRSREAAEFVMAQWKENDATKSKNYRVVEVP